jgi:ABC-type transport system involved in multi-copper enzyme maturation permease subunit
MLMGPVFRAELLRTGRRRRYYFLRFLYGALLLLVFWSSYEGEFWNRSIITITEMAQFGESTFITFAIVQLVTVLVLVPPLFAGTITDEKQRKTLHYLMASQLSSGEIILDKVLARSAHLAVFLAIGLPVVSILGFFGGIAPDQVICVYIGTLSTTAYAVALAVLVSTLARRVRQAVLCTYLLSLAWLFVPTLIGSIGTALFPTSYPWVGIVNDWLVNLSPSGLFFLSVSRWTGFSAASLLIHFAWMVGLQLAGTILLLLVAIRRLRPTFRRQEEVPARTTWFRARKSRRRARTHPECGEDAVLWKERYFAPSDIFTKLVLLPSIVAVTVPLILVVETVGGFGDYFYSLWQSGLRYAPDNAARLAWALRIYLGWYSAFWLLAVAGAAASAITIERETDTWVSLTSTPLTGWEILRAKVVGAVWNQRGFAAVMIFVWFMALVTTAVHPLEILKSVAIVALLTWMVAAIGVSFSMRAQSTSRALVATITTLCVLNGYPFILLALFLSEVRWSSSFTLLGAMPWLGAGPIVSLRPWNEPPWPPGANKDPTVAQELLTQGRWVLLTIYLGTTILLTLRMLKNFDDWLDRPSLLRTTDVPAKVAAPSAEAEPAILA